MKIKALFAALAGLMMCSCTTVYHTSETSDVKTNIYSLEVADLDISTTKVEKTYSWEFNPFNRVSVETVKSNTTAQLLKEANADVLVEPQYIVEKHGFMRGGSVTVIGFPAKYKNFHKATQEESKIISEVLKAEKSKQKAKKRFFFF